MLGSLAQHYGFSLEEPFDELGAEHQKVVLYGSGRENVDFRYLNDRGDIVKRSHPFEGILPNLERRYRETESATVREELAKFLSTQPCPDCHGTRLRREAGMCGSATGRCRRSPRCRSAKPASMPPDSA